METGDLPDFDADTAAAGRAFRALFEFAPVGIAAYTLDRRVFAANPALQRLVGISDYRGLLVGGLAPPERVATLNDLLAKVAAGEAVATEGPIVRGDGTRLEVRATLMPVHGPTGDQAFGLAVVEPADDDVALRDAVGQAKEFVHDIANLLVPLAGYAELLISRLPAEDPARRDAEHLRDAAERAVAVARAGLGPTPRESAADESVDVNGVVAGLRPLAGDLLGAGIEIVLAPDLGAPHAKADAVGLERAIVNIAANARDAMPGGGRFTIVTRREGDFVVVELADTGVGIDRETQDRIFERDFTTKATGHGLGLASVRDFARRHGGSVTVESKPGEGATFRLTLPAAD